MAENSAQPDTERDPEAAPRSSGRSWTASVLETYTAALGRLQSERNAFDAAVQNFLLYNPNVPEAVARRAVAEIIASKD